MIEILQNIIDFLTQTPTLYVDGIACEVQCCWIGAAIGAIVGLGSAGMSAQASSSQAAKLRRAAQKNYNMLMENANMSKMQLNEQMDLYAEDMDSYRSSMIQRYALAGGVRANDSQLAEVRNYDFGIEEIDTATMKKEADELRKAKIDNYIADAKARFQPRYSDEQGDVTWEDVEPEVRARAEKKFKSSDEMMTEALGNILSTGWQGKEASFATGRAGNSAILNLRTSVSNMQRDLSNAYKTGMIDYWRQRKNAQNVKDTQAFQAAGYSTQAQTTMASGFMSAIQYGAQAYSQYKAGR